MGFGIFPYQGLAHVAAPAAGSLLSAGTYSQAVLSSGGRLVAHGAPFTYFSAAELLTVAGTLLAGLALCWGHLRVREPRPVTWLRALHNGSVNDYTAYLTAGSVTTIVVLLAFAA